jgi:hypothetical protein
MSFRSDRDADRARIEALEQDLAASRRRLAELEACLRPTQRRRPRLVGPPETRLRFGHYLRRYYIDAELTWELFADAMRTLEDQAEEPGEIVFENARCTAWHSRPCSIELVVHDGRSTLTCTAHQDTLSAPLWFAIAIVSLIGGFTCLGWTGFAMAFFAASFGGAQLAVNRRDADRAQQRFDRAATLLGIETTGQRPHVASRVAGSL